MSRAIPVAASESETALLRDRLEQQSYRANALAQTMEERLQPVLRPENNNNTVTMTMSPKPPQPHRSPLACHLHDVYDRLDQVLSRMENFLERVDL